MSDALRRLGQVAAQMPPARKSARGHQHVYLDLPGLLAHITPVLTANGLSAVCEVTADEAGRVGVRYQFVSEDDIYMTPWFWLPGARNAQDAGGHITYARRYVLSAACGVPEAETVATSTTAQSKGVKSPHRDAAPGGTSPMSEQMRKALQASYRSMPRAERLAYWAELIGRQVATANELTATEANLLLEKGPPA